MADHVRILRTYLAHLRCKAPTQSTRPRWCDVHAALEEAIRVMSEPATQPPAVGVDVSDEMVSAGTVLSNIVYNLAQDDRLPEALRTSLDAARKRWDAALRTGGGES